MNLRHANRVLPLLLMAGLCSCAWRIEPPSEVREPVKVYLSEYGRHTRLALPDPEGQFIEFGFGDWYFYGKEERNPLSALRALAGGGGGALSRRVITANPEGGLSMQTTGSSRTEALAVEQELAVRLKDDLEARWQKAGTVVVREWDGIPVRRVPQRYHLLGNSNHATAGWMTELGCKIRGTPVTSHFRIVRKNDGAE
jgi:hypothetical protein